MFHCLDKEKIKNNKSQKFCK